MGDASSYEDFSVSVSDEEQRRRADEATENVIRQMIEAVQDLGQTKSFDIRCHM